MAAHYRRGSGRGSRSPRASNQRARARYTAEPLVLIRTKVKFRRSMDCRALIRTCLTEQDLNTQSIIHGLSKPARSGSLRVDVYSSLLVCDHKLAPMRPLLLQLRGRLVHSPIGTVKAQ